MTRRTEFGGRSPGKDVHVAPPWRASSGAPAATPVHLCLGGGSALGAYVAGAVEAVLERGIQPDVIAGVSVGATIGAIVAGNRPADRLPQLKAYWALASSGGMPGLPLADATTLPMLGHASSGRGAINALHALNSMLSGRPGFFRPRWPGILSLLPFMPADPALLDPKPLIDTVQRFVNFDYLNRQGPRLLVHAVDVQTGEPVRFDSRDGGIAPEHLVAATSLPPGFPPMQLGERWFADAGLVANVPLDHALFEANGPRAVLAIDPFCAHGRLPVSLDDSMHRAQDIVFAAQTERTLAAFARERRLLNTTSSMVAGASPVLSRSKSAAERVNVVVANYRAPEAATGAKALDFSQRSLQERWATGCEDMARLLARAETAGGPEQASGFSLCRNVPT